VQDIRNTDVNEAAVVVLNLVLQFLDSNERLPLLTRLRKQMAPDSLLIVSEKVRHENPAEHAYFDGIHLAWKKANGYSDLEIAQKRSALENVMIIDTEAVHVQRFNNAGFSRVNQWYRCMNWASFLVQP
jgi:tRNA (cmo5U34)-methyltransferase